MIIDTNVLLRALDGSETPHSRSARGRIEAARAAGETLAVLSATVLEAIYVLESERAGYGWDRDAIARALSAIVHEPAFEVEHGPAFEAATATYRTRAIDLHDCLLAALADQRGTRVLSFDEDLRTLGPREPP